MSSARKSRIVMLLLTALALILPAVLGACVRTFGAPREDDYPTESNAEAMEEEEESDAWEDANR